MADTEPRGAARRRRFLIEWAAVSSAAAAVLLALSLSGATNRIDNLYYDLLVRLAPPPPSDRIVIVAIDEASLEALGRWPWPRARHAELLHRLAEARPRAIAYDVLFPEPDPADGALAEAIRAARPVFLAINGEVPGPDGRAALLREPAPPLARAAAALGHVDLAFDDDGAVRRAFLRESDGVRTAPQLMKAVADALAGPAPAPPPMRPTAGLGRAEEQLIPFHGAPGGYRTMPFAAVLKGEVPAEVFRDRVVLVGATAAGLGDRYATPMGGAGGSPGVEIQANLLQGLMERRLVRTAAPVWGLGLGALAVAALMAGCRRLSPRAAFALAAGLGLGLALISAGALLGLGWFIPPAAGVLTLALIYPLWSWRRLEAASGYMLAELQRFQGDGELWPDPPPASTGDLVSRQLEAMDAAVARLRNLRRFVADAVHALPDPTVVVGPDGAVLLANARAEALFESPRGRPWRGLVADWRFSTPQDGEAEAHAPNGAVYRLRTVTHLDNAARPDFLITRLTDVTALRAATEQRERLLALLTHDMRSPQASILALLKTAPRDAVPPELARQIGLAAERTLALADNFVLLARAQAETYDLQPLSLSALLVEAADELWPQSALGAVQVELHGHEDEEHIVMGDRSLLTRALVNLIGNAIKYSDAGGKVVCTLSKSARSAVCTVADNGRGMGPAELARIYQPFERTGDQRGGGAGLGLAMVRAVAQRHGGQLEHRSAPGEGTIAVLTLPLAF